VQLASNAAATTAIVQFANLPTDSAFPFKLGLNNAKPAHESMRR
jgi:hypothetical protein